MKDQPSPITLILATRNAHKVEEIGSILGEGFVCITLADFPAAPRVEEDANTFAGNATRKSVQLAHWFAGNWSVELKNRSGFVLADDSGLEVDALDGAPGVYSARFAGLDSGKGGSSSDTENNAKLLRLLKDVPAARRTARFRCVIAVTPVLPGEAKNASPVCGADEFEIHTKLFDGMCEGRIGLTSQGRGGFGYDPLFVPDGFTQTFAELGEDVKNRLSHRARALEKLKISFSRK